MPSRGARRWLLFVDESGDFASEGEAVVGGVLAREDHILGQAGFGEWLRAAVPWSPWPIHAAHVNSEGYQLLMYEHQHRAGKCERDAILEDALRRLTEVPSHELDRCRAAVGRGARPDIHDLRAVVRRLSRLHRASLRSRVHRYRTAMRRAVGILADEAGVLGAAGMSLVVASQSGPHRPAKLPEPASAERTARYVELLGRCIERATCIVAALRNGPGVAPATSDEDEIRLTIATRDVFDPVLGTDAALHFRHLAPLVTAGNSVAAACGARSIPLAIVAYDSTAHPLLVIADHAVNRAREQTGSLKDPLPVVEKAVQLATGLLVRTTRTHLTGTHDGAVLKRWVREERREWSSAAGIPAQPPAGGTR